VRGRRAILLGVVAVLLAVATSATVLARGSGQSEQERLAEIGAERGRSASEGAPDPQPVPDHGGIFGGSVYPSLAALERGWRTDFTKHTVPLSDFQRGGPGRDGIRSVDRPWVLPADEVDFLPEDEPVLEVIVNGEARAYPFGMLVLREIVNDTVGEVPVVVTFCPLCNTALAFVRNVQGRTLSFGVTGNLRNSDLVMYDRQTESWWQQFGGEALVGRFAGARLRQLPAQGIWWSEFRERHDDGLLVTTRSEFELPYGKNPYLGYLDPRVPSFFPAANAGDRRLPPSERVVFLERSGESVAIPFSVLEERGHLAVEVGGARVVVSLNDRTASVRDEHGRLVSFSEPFWFAVAAFRPDVEIVDG
jgi:hypothetical protein